MSGAFPLFLLVAFFLVMWLLFIRPQQRRQRELASMQGSLEVGDEVMLTSGVYGVLRALEDDAVHLEIADGVQIRVARPAVGRVVTTVDQPDEATTSDPEGSDTEDGSTRDDDVPKEN